MVTTAALSIMEGKDVYGNDVDPTQVHDHFLFLSRDAPILRLVYTVLALVTTRVAYGRHTAGRGFVVV